MKRRYLLAAMVGLWFCASAAAGEFRVTDLAGRRVRVPDDPGRIICLGPGALRLIVYLKAQDLVVGVESMEKQHPTGRPYWIAQPRLKMLPTVSPGGAGAINKKPDMEAVLRVAPDLIVATYMEAGLADEVADTLGIPVVILSYGELAVFDTAVFDSLRLAGRILSRSQRAAAVVDFIDGTRKDLRRRSADIPDDAKPSVYAGGIGYRGTRGIESTQRDYIPLDWNRAVNAARHVKATVGSCVLMDKEILLKLDPDVIFIDGAGLPLVRQDYRRKPDFYQSLTAIKGRRVYSLLPFNYYTTNIDTAMVDAYAIGKILYPDRFADVDPVKQADTIYTFLVGKPVCSRMQEDFAPLGQPVRLDE